MYKVYQIFIMILKFDVFFQLGFSAQFLYVVVLQSGVDGQDHLSHEDVRNILILHLILSTGASIVLPILAWWGLKRESKLAISCFIAGGVAAMVYNIMKLSQVLDKDLTRFSGAQKFLSFFLIVNLLLGLVTIYLAWVCMKNFNNGLSAHIGKVSGTNIYPMDSVSEAGNSSRPSTKRWSIE
ncbi:hypothetical protein BGZ83_010490 [Gryganskiella cystojenkinii]|nr:hypothetical protein BGZ83_010490 [Gryganskiella cystojenkinii]